MFANTPNARRIPLALLLIFSTVLAYQGAWNGGFIWDDDDYVTRNPLLTESDGWGKIWFSLEAPSQYFPLVYTVFRLERTLWDFHPAGYHWVNIVLHIANALLVWQLLARLKVPGAFLAALIFALHPVQVESVAWITELKNVLMGFFFLLTLLAWTAFADEQAKRRSRFYVAAIIFYGLALSAKTTACTLPAALLLILWLQGRPITKQRGWQIAPFVLLGVAMGLVTVWWERYHQGTRGEFFVLGPIERLLVASHAVWFYLSKVFWPADLTFIYPQWSVSASDPWNYLWIVACVVAAGLIFLIRKRVGRSVEVAGVFFVCTLGPMLGLIMLYTFRYTYVADHYQYLACIGPIALTSAALTGGMNRLTGTRRKQLIIAVYATVIAVLGTLTWRQAATYRDVETLWRSTVAKNPDCWMAYNNLGVVLSRKGEFEEAIENYNKSLQRHVESKALLNYAEAHYNLANALLEKGDVRRALAECLVAVRLEPNNSDAQVALGNALLASGDLNESIVHYNRALELRTDNADALYNLGNALQQKGEIASAADHYEKALAIAPEIGEAHLNLGNILFQQGKEGEAIRHYEKALAVSPRSGKAQNNLAWALATASQTSLRDGRKALKLAQEADDLAKGMDPLILNTLAAAYAETGQFDRALETVDRSLALAMSTENIALANELHRVQVIYATHFSYQKPR